MTTPKPQDKRPRGRPRLSAEDRAPVKKPRSIRLGDEHWAKLQRLGSQWLERAIDRAKG